MNRSKRKNFKGGRYSLNEDYIEGHKIGTVLKVIKDPTSHKIKKGELVELVSEAVERKKTGLSLDDRTYYIVKNEDGKVDSIRKDKLKFIKGPENNNNNNNCPPCDKELTKKDV